MDARSVDDFKLLVLTPMGEVLDTRAVALRVTAWDGQLGVLAHHAPMVAQLEIGPSVVTEADGERRWLATASGVLRVTSNEVVLMVQAAEEAEEIDIERAQKAFERAEHRLSTRGDSTDMSRAELALARAANRLKVAQQIGAGPVR